MNSVQVFSISTLHFKTVYNAGNYHPMDGLGESILQYPGNLSSFQILTVSLQNTGILVLYWNCHPHEIKDLFVFVMLFILSDFMVFASPFSFT